jgi:hypothetical protein
MAGRLRILMASIAVCVVLVPAQPAPAATNGVFWFTCTKSHRLADDPIVYPNQPGAAHMHDFYGNVTARASSTFESMLGADTTCNVILDSAGYWSPTLYNPQMRVVGIEKITLYYRGDRGKTEAFPPDLRIIAGATVGRPTGAGGTGWACVNAQGLYPTIHRCASQVKARVTFPGCWDGVHLDVPDHHSHLAYGSGDKCPPSHPVKLPRLEVQIVYKTRGGPGFHLASDMMGNWDPGESLHADFWNTWDQDELERLVRDCINGTRLCKNLDTR